MGGGVIGFFGGAGGLNAEGAENAEGAGGGRPPGGLVGAAAAGWG